jgi:hypothetical protein
MEWSQRDECILGERVDVSPRTARRWVRIARLRPLGSAAVDAVALALDAVRTHLQTGASEALLWMLDHAIAGDVLLARAPAWHPGREGPAPHIWV